MFSARAFSAPRMEVASAIVLRHRPQFQPRFCHRLRDYCALALVKGRGSAVASESLRIF